MCRIDALETAQTCQQAKTATNTRIFNLLLSQEVSEVCDCVGRVANEEGFRLLAVVLLAVDVRQNGRNLSICQRPMSVKEFLHWMYSVNLRTSVLVSDDLHLAVQCVRNRAVRVAKGNANSHTLARLGTGLRNPFFRHFS
jgi:hypothetical protein